VLAGSSYALARAANCSVSKENHVVLSSDAIDPDVFVWDTRDHLVDYAAARWDSSRAVSERTVLAKKGTHAVVKDCAPALAHPHYTEPQDVIQVLITTGPFRGHVGWVISADLHRDVEKSVEKNKIVTVPKPSPSPRP
jgi:hypothetical protein